MSKNRKLRNQVAFNKKFGSDILLALAALILPMVILVIGSLLLLFPILGTILMVVYLLSILSIVYLPIYVANWIANTFKLDIELKYLVALSYLGLLLFNILSLVVPVLALINLVLGLANLGFLARESYKMITSSLKKEAQE